jgi:hypothetical protein
VPRSFELETVSIPSKRRGMVPDLSILVCQTAYVAKRQPTLAAAAITLVAKRMLLERLRRLATVVAASEEKMGVGFNGVTHSFPEPLQKAILKTEGMLAT